MWHLKQKTAEERKFRRRYRSSCFTRRSVSYQPEDDEKFSRENKSAREKKNDRALASQVTVIKTARFDLVAKTAMSLLYQPPVYIIHLEMIVAQLN